MQNKRNHDLGRENDGIPRDTTRAVREEPASALQLNQESRLRQRYLTVQIPRNSLSLPPFLPRRSKQQTTTLTSDRLFLGSLGLGLVLRTLLPSTLETEI